MLMAAGLGTRLRPFTLSTPKAFIPVMSVPVVQFAVDSLVSAGAKKIVANIHHHAEAAMSRFGNLDLNGSELVISDESNCLLGSGGGIRKALPLLGSGPFFVLNADVMCDVDMRQLSLCHAALRAKHGVGLTLAIFQDSPISETGYREIIINYSTGLIEGLGNLKNGRPFFVGAAVIEPEIVANLPLNCPSEFVPSILTPAIEARRAGAYLASGWWHDIGSPKLWLDTHMALIDGLEDKQKLLPHWWRDRIEAKNRRLGPYIWVNKSATLNQSNLSHWQAPCYWSQDDQLPSQLAPVQFGPNAVLYGQAPNDAHLANGIGYCGEWV